ncbi:hypothetical protein AAFC00_006703 [Neodothiora populina]|uniref:Uncharacterized protein n=1 Tax=Neodothiora populina TaxID=2781224 RepID=A0ABR3PAX1_9PEZI
MVSDVHMHDHSPHHTPRDTIKKRKRISDQHLPQPTRQHQRKTSLNDRTFSINTRRRLDFAFPPSAAAAAAVAGDDGPTMSLSSPAQVPTTITATEDDNGNTFIPLLSIPKPEPSSQPQQDTSKCYDWLLQQKGIHYTRNATWFTTYTPLNISLSSGLWCQGIGTVTLSPLLQQLPNTGSHHGNNNSQIILRDVLHLPKAPCNGISLPLMSSLLDPVYEAGPSTATLPACLKGLRDTKSGHVFLTNKVRGGWDRLMLLGGAANTEQSSAGREISLLGTAQDDWEEDDMESAGGVSYRLLDLAVCLSENDVQRIAQLVGLASDAPVPGPVSVSAIRGGGDGDGDEEMMCQNGS